VFPSQLRDTDVDMLERTVTMIAFGDIEAEDTRHLTETNFVRIFRLAQLTVEYLLYVQDCLSSTHKHAAKDRWAHHTLPALQVVHYRHM
jgi:zinc finger protein DZIP1